MGPKMDIHLVRVYLEGVVLVVDHTIMTVSLKSADLQTGLVPRLTPLPTTGEERVGGVSRR